MSLPSVSSLSVGLQQGTVNSPILFNIYISNILELFELNKTKDKGALAFADDLIAYISGKKPSEINQNLEILVDKIHFFYDTWKKKLTSINVKLYYFDAQSVKVIGIYKKIGKNCKIKVNNQIIPHKKIVKYLGVELDKRVLFNKHLENKLIKARAAFMGLKNYFSHNILIQN